MDTDSSAQHHHDDDVRRWPRAPLLVLRDEDVVTCAAGLARTVQEPAATLWLVVLDADGWTAAPPVELVNVPLLPASGDLPVLRELLAGIAALRAEDPELTLVAAFYRPTGGDRGRPERAWARALQDTAADAGLPVRGIAAVGDARARLLTAGAVA